MLLRITFALLSLFLGTSQLLAQNAAKNLGFSVPEGFEVSLYADDALVTDIHAMTVDAKGRIVVASKGYIKILHDTKRAGKADKATIFSTLPKSGAHGMYFDGNDLICNGDQGVRRLVDSTGQGKADTFPPPWFSTKNDGEHAANGIVRGPDGWYYMITGNDAGISSEHANTPTSPIKTPNSGVVVRFSHDGKKREIVAHGFRNPYDLAFTANGEIVTVDADGERIHYMPYYAPTRLFDIGQGMHHGWILPGWAGGWSRPPIWADSTARAWEIGRGSPTGILVYRHRQFPERYRNGIFSACWTFGRVYYFPVERDGSTFKTKMEVFMQTTGDVGFAPTDMVVGPNGDLFIAIGGRGTRGSVFRVTYKGPNTLDVSGPLSINLVLSADEPLSSWSRAKWVPEAKKIGVVGFVAAAANVNLGQRERIRAIEILTELFPDSVELMARRVCVRKGEDPEIIARVLWAVSRMGKTDYGRTLFAENTFATHPRIARAAWEALQALPYAIDGKLACDWTTALTSTDRRVRAAALAVAQGKGRLSFLNAYPNSFSGPAGVRLAQCWGAEKNTVMSLSTGVFNSEKSVALRLEAVRLMQIALGDVKVDPGATKPFTGYLAANPDGVTIGHRLMAVDAIRKQFPTGNSDLDRECARVLGMLAVSWDDFPKRIASLWTKTSLPEDDIHYLLAFSRMTGKRDAEVTRQTAFALNSIQVKLAQRGAKPTDQVPGILESLLDRLLELDPALAQALVNDPHFGLPDHAVYAHHLPDAEKQIATRKLLARIAKLDEDDARAAWTPELVKLVGTLPDKESLPILRAQFADPRLSDNVALLLAKKGDVNDRARFLDALASPQTPVVIAAGEALAKLQVSAKSVDPLEVGKVVRAYRRLETQKPDPKSRLVLLRLLESWTDLKLPNDSAQTWVSWYTTTYPKQAAQLPGLASANFATWKKRLDTLDSSDGDTKRGEALFQRKSCFRCHGEARRLGPDLTGIAQRFSRDDLFVAIIDPSKDIAPAYRPTTIITKSGKTHNGMLIYDSPALTLLQTTPDTTVRISREDLQLIQPSTISFMPAGLLDDLTDIDLRDLYAYMKGLRKK